MPINTGYPPSATEQNSTKKKPAMGFKLPSAGVTPAPSDRKKGCGTSSLLEVLMGERSDSYLARYFTGEAAGRIAASGEGSGPHHNCPTAHSFCHSSAKRRIGSRLSLSGRGRASAAGEGQHSKMPEMCGPPLPLPISSRPGQASKLQFNRGGSR